MREQERRALLDRIDREGASVGATVPESIEIDGETLPLADLVRRAEHLDADRRTDLRTRVRRERTRLREAIVEDRVDHETAERYADRIAGLDRALAHLDVESDIEAAATAAEQADRKRWRSFVKRVRGDEDADGRAR
ncbi:DUF5788 family protein [Halococcoides cellulosivorans]|uniref:Uncharacterized protein n=1 Tax=Halococcoides cellulosivorans TaxID=1679096 RepID=A0A2R4WZ13_9EURY|nr:DUF5788 family protein [Halococcoides cellulosivorans]AWB26789.1 hypothetical protein HARCEL1_03185 [Halococcoides cellulosivorans]